MREEISEAGHLEYSRQLEKLTEGVGRESFTRLLEDKADIFERYVKGEENREEQLELYAQDYGVPFKELVPPVQKQIRERVEGYESYMADLVEGSREFLSGEINEETSRAASELAWNAYNQELRWLEATREELDAMGEAEESRTGRTRADLELCLGSLKESTTEARKAYTYVIAASLEANL